MNDGRNLFIWLFLIIPVLEGLGLLETVLEVPQI